MFIQNPQKEKVTSFAKMPQPKSITIYHKEKSFFIVSETKVYKITHEGILFPNPSRYFLTYCIQKDSSVFLLGILREEMKMVLEKEQDSTVYQVLQLINKLEISL
jgi:hypothetical protein